MHRTKTPTSLPSRRNSAMEETMLTREDAQLIFELKNKGHGSRFIARTLGLSRTTVRRYLKRGQWTPRAPAERSSVLDGLDDWLRHTFLTHHGNAAVVHQLLEKEHGIQVSLRCVQKAVAPFRQQLKACNKATVRFETPPAHQMQADFGERRVVIAGEPQRVHFAVLTLGFSRRCYVQAFTNEKQLNWLRAIEAAFERFGSVPDELWSTMPARLSRVTARTRSSSTRSSNSSASSGGHPASMQTLSCTNQGQGRERRQVCQTQRLGRPRVR